MTEQGFGEYLKKLRGSKSLGQIEALSGVTKSYLSKVERGERGIPSPSILSKLAPVLGVTYEELMNAAGYSKSDEPAIFPEYPLRKKYGISDGMNIDEMMEVFHKNPKLRILFSRSANMSDRDIDFMLQLAERMNSENEDGV